MPLTVVTETPIASDREDKQPMGWRKAFLRQQEEIATSKDDATLVMETIALRKFYPQVKLLLPSKGKRRFRLTQMAIDRELNKRGLTVIFPASARPASSHILELTKK